jgi:hypothetical protein
MGFSFQARFDLFVLKLSFQEVSKKGACERREDLKYMAEFRFRSIPLCVLSGQMKRSHNRYWDNTIVF